MHDSLQPELIFVTTIFLALSFIIVALRCWSSYIIPDHKLGLDDWCAAASLPFILAQSAVLYRCIQLGLGKDAAEVPTDDIVSVRKLLFASSFFFQTAIILPKWSALAFYHRIFGRTVSWFYVSLWILAIVNGLWLFAAYFLALLQCRPIEGVWRSDVPAQCIPQWEWLTGLAAPSMVIDLIILLLPMPLLWGVQTSLKRKLMMTAVFAAGYCVLIVSIGRLITLANDRSSLAVDPTHSIVDYLEWAQCEAPVSVISVSLPNIFTLFRRMHEHGAAFILTGRPSSNPPRPPPKTGYSLAHSPLLEKRHGAYLPDLSLSNPRQERGRQGNSRLDSYPSGSRIAPKTLEFGDARTMASMCPYQKAMTTVPKPPIKKSTIPLPPLNLSSIVSSPQRDLRWTPRDQNGPSIDHIVTQQSRRPRQLHPSVSVSPISQWGRSGPMSPVSPIAGSASPRKVHFMTDTYVGSDGRLYNIV